MQLQKRNRGWSRKLRGCVAAPPSSHGTIEYDSVKRSISDSRSKPSSQVAILRQHLSVNGCVRDRGKKNVTITQYYRHSKVQVFRPVLLYVARNYNV